MQILDKLALEYHKSQSELPSLWKDSDIKGILDKQYENYLHTMTRIAYYEKYPAFESGEKVADHDFWSYLRLFDRRLYPEAEVEKNVDLIYFAISMLPEDDEGLSNSIGFKAFK